MTDTNTPSNNTNTSAPTEEQSQLRRFRAGFHRVESLIRAVPTKDLEPIAASATE